LNDSPIASLASTCDSAFFLNKHSFHSATAGDRTMLPWIEGVIAEARATQRPMVVFVHLLAQHPPLDRDYEGADLPYGGKGMVAQYMRSTRETDRFLGELYAMVRQVPSHNMFYFSDHGLGYDPKRDHFIHMDKYKECYHVPLVIWTDHAGSGRTIEQPVSLMDLVGMVHGLNTGEGAGLDELLPRLPHRSVVFSSRNTPKPIADLLPNPIEFSREH
jgi:glucan phosphoethanolaminetransferase (alkaline phosphatase superfamily)